MNAQNKTFEQWLETYWMDKEYEGQSKDDCEVAFENWLECRDVAEMMEFAEQWGQLQKIEGKEYILKGFEESIEALKKLTIIK